MIGVATALVTPFRNGTIDWKAFDVLLKQQGDAGIHAVVPCGTTGENPTLSFEERKKLITVCVSTFKGSQTQVVVGTGANSTQESILLSRSAESLGADGLLIVTPYYNKPTQEGLYQHYAAIHESTQIPIVLYNVPSRTCVSLTVETILRLSKLPRITSLKEATGNMTFDQEILSALKKAGSKMTLLSGDDPTFLDFLKLGGHGCISVASNLVPSVVLKIFEKKDASLQKKYLPLFQNLFIETNPSPVKYALSKQGWMSPEVRLPLVELSATSKQLLDTTLSEFEL